MYLSYLSLAAPVIFFCWYEWNLHRLLYRAMREKRCILLLEGIFSLGAGSWTLLLTGAAIFLFPDNRLFLLVLFTFLSFFSLWRFTTYFLTDIERYVRSFRRQAAATTTVKQEFLANIGHEIRTPLNGIIGMSELLQRTELTFQQREYLESINDSAALLLTVMNEMLDYSTATSGKLSFAERPFQLRSLLRSTVNLLKVDAAAKNLELHCQVEADVTDQWIGDPLRIQQLILILAANAFKFTLEGKVKIMAKTVGKEPDHSQLKITVSDTGIGISPQQRDRLFAPFVQGDGSMTRRFGGTGMGLALCQKIVLQMGGEIGVESELGKGSDFWFSLPLASGNNQLLRRSPANMAVEAERIQALRELAVTGADDLLNELITIYLQDTPAMVSQIDQAIATENEAFFQLVINNFKSSSVNVGAIRLGRMTDQFAAWAKNGEWSNCRRHYEVLTAEFDQVCVELQQMIAD